LLPLDAALALLLSCAFSAAAMMSLPAAAPAKQHMGKSMVSRCMQLQSLQQGSAARMQIVSECVDDKAIEVPISTE
jgi:hypothetical protein